MAKTKNKTLKKPATKTEAKEEKTLRTSSFADGLRYPWGEPKRLLNGLWFLIPIVGWFALTGYFQKILRALVAGNKTSLPEFVDFSDNLKSGFIIFVKAIPLFLAHTLLYSVPLIGQVAGWVAFVFFMPYLYINLMVTKKFEEGFNVQKAFDAVSNNLKEYIIAYLKSIGFVAIYGLPFLMLIIPQIDALAFLKVYIYGSLFMPLVGLVLIGIPCLSFGHAFYLAEFYAKHS